MATPIVPKVLLVDDEELVRCRLATIIAPAGFQVLTAPDGETALAPMRRDFTSIVILDVRMPGSG
jgi:DNA-binding response OmpR family regulator